MNCCNQDCRQGRDCPARTKKIDEPMNSTQKLTDEALQVYRATGLSPLELWAQRVALMASVVVAANLLFDSGNHKAARELYRLLKKCK